MIINESENIWFRRSIQDYDVTQFWNNIDWYATGYNQFSEIDDIIEGSYLLSSLENNIGQTVKINSVGAGGWLLLEKIAEEEMLPTRELINKYVPKKNTTIVKNTTNNFVLAIAANVVPIKTWKPWNPVAM